MDDDYLNIDLHNDSIEFGICLNPDEKIELRDLLEGKIDMMQISSMGEDKDYSDISIFRKNTGKIYLEQCLNGSFVRFCIDDFLDEIKSMLDNHSERDLTDLMDSLEF